MFGGAAFAEAPFAASPLAVVPALPIYAPELTLGPPMRGAPWLRRLPVSEFARDLVHSDRSPPTYAPEVHTGPPLRGAPWLGRIPMTEAGLLKGVAVVPTNRGIGQRPFLPRVPKESDERRLARFTEKLSQIVNSLIIQNLLVQTGATTWTLAGAKTGSMTTGPSGTFNSGTIS